VQFHIGAKERKLFELFGEVGRNSSELFGEVGRNSSEPFREVGRNSSELFREIGRNSSKLFREVRRNFVDFKFGFQHEVLMIFSSKNMCFLSILRWIGRLMKIYLRVKI
jgi:hypothetical protein